MLLSWWPVWASERRTLRRPRAAAHPLTIAGFFAALVAALWAYDGWNNVSMVASEIRQPQRSLPLALIAGTLAVIAIYLAANAAYFHVLSAQQVGASERVAADMMRHVVGGWGAHAVSIAAMISIFAALNGSILSGARVPYAMARDRLFFASVAKVNAAYHTPGVSILALSAWSALLVLSGRYEQLFTYVIFASWILIWHDHGGGYRTSAQAARSAAALQDASLSRTSGTFCARGDLAGTFDSVRLSAGIAAWIRFYFSWIAVLFLLETAALEASVGPIGPKTIMQLFYSKINRCDYLIFFARYVKKRCEAGVVEIAGHRDTTTDPNHTSHEVRGDTEWMLPRFSWNYARNESKSKKQF